MTNVHSLMAARTSSRAHLASWLLCAPGMFWVCCFLALPLLSVVAMSFLSLDEVGEVGLPLTTESYRRFLGFGPLGFEPLYPRILFHTAILAATVTFLGLVLALPTAFFLAGLAEKSRARAMTLVVIPLWTNLVVRTYAWQFLLGPSSWLSEWAQRFGWLGAGEGLYPGAGAVMLGMLCDYLPFLVLPLYASVEKIDWLLVEAAIDLGASGWMLFRRAILPQIAPGLAAGALFTFIPALGQFVVPDLLGGGKTVLLGNLIQQQFGPSSDWPFGSAIAVITLTLLAVGLWIRRSLETTDR